MPLEFEDAFDFVDKSCGRETEAHAKDFVSRAGFQGHAGDSGQESVGGRIAGSVSQRVKGSFVGK